MTEPAKSLTEYERPFVGTLERSICDSKKMRVTLPKTNGFEQFIPGSRVYVCEYSYGLLCYSERGLKENVEEIQYPNYYALNVESEGRITVKGFDSFFEATSVTIMGRGKSFDIVSVRKKESS